MNEKERTINNLADNFIKYAEEVRLENSNNINRDIVLESLNKASKKYESTMEKQKRETIETMSTMVHHIHKIAEHLNELMTYKSILNEYDHDIHDNYVKCSDSYLYIAEDLEREMMNLKDYIGALKKDLKRKC